jgi:hypothetical protein
LIKNFFLIASKARERLERRQVSRVLRSLQKEKFARKHYSQNGSRLGNAPHGQKKPKRLTTDQLGNLTRPDARGLGARNKSVSMSWRV